MPFGWTVAAQVRDGVGRAGGDGTWSGMMEDEVEVEVDVVPETVRGYGKLEWTLIQGSKGAGAVVQCQRPGTFQRGPVVAVRTINGCG
jgi:hypothetical protein